MPPLPLLMWNRFGRVVTLEIGSRRWRIAAIEIVTAAPMSAYQLDSHFTNWLSPCEGPRFMIKHALPCDRVMNVLFWFFTTYAILLTTTQPPSCGRRGVGQLPTYDVLYGILFYNLNPLPRAFGYLGLWGQLPQLPFKFTTTPFFLDSATITNFQLSERRGSTVLR